MRARCALLLSACLGLALLAGCHPVRTCDKGTLFIELTADASAAGADQLLIDATFGSQTLHSEVSYAGQAVASLALDFPAGYPANQSLALTVTAMKGTTAVASGATTMTLAPGCTRLDVALTAAGAGGVTLVGASSSPPAHTSSVSLAPPSGAQAGDFLLLCLYANSSTVVATLPAGWVTLDELTSTRGFHVWWLTATADASLANVSATFDQAATLSAVLVGYHSSAGSPSVDVHSTPATLTGAASVSAISFDAPGVTTTHANERLATFFVYDSGDGGNWPGTPAGTTKLADTGSIALFERAAPTAGDSGTTTATAAFATGDEVYGTALVAAVVAP
jgi:hypothetical protein